MRLLIHHFLLMTAILFWVSPDTVLAQQDEKPIRENLLTKTQKYALGLRLGPVFTFGHINNLVDKDRFSSLPKLGFTVSPQLSMPLGNNYAFITELGYLRTGRKMKLKSNDWVTSFNYNFLTASMALRKSVRVYFAENLQGDIFFNVGPTISYLVNGKGKIIINAPPPKGPGTWEGASPDTSNWRNASWIGAKFDMVYGQSDSSEWGNFKHYYINNANRLLFGLDIGIGAEAPITRKQNVYFELRYTWGHTNLGNSQTQANLNILNFEDTQFVNLQTISFNLLYTFDFDSRGLKKGRSTEKRKRTTYPKRK